VPSWLALDDDSLNFQLFEDDHVNATTALKSFLERVASFVYHVGAINTPRKRKRDETTDLRSSNYAIPYQSKARTSLQMPLYANRLRSFMLLLPYDVEDIDVPPLRTRKYHSTELVENDAEVERVFRLLEQNVPHLRRFEYSF
jgi:hypothetical protein